MPDSMSVALNEEMLVMDSPRYAVVIDRQWIGVSNQPSPTQRSLNVIRVASVWLVGRFPFCGSRRAVTSEESHYLADFGVYVSRRLRHSHSCPTGRNLRCRCVGDDHIFRRPRTWPSAGSQNIVSLYKRLAQTDIRISPVASPNVLLFGFVLVSMRFHPDRPCRCDRCSTAGPMKQPKRFPSVPAF